MSEEKPYEVIFDPGAGLRTSNNASPDEHSFGSKRIRSATVGNWAVGGKKGGKKRAGSSPGTKKSGAGRKRK